MKSFFAKIFAKVIVPQINKWKNNPIDAQNKEFGKLIKGARDTEFGREHNFHVIQSYHDFKACLLYTSPSPRDS